MALINKEQEYQDQEKWSDKVQKLKDYNIFRDKVNFWAEQRGCIHGPYEIVFDEELGWCVDVDGDVGFRGLTIIKIPFQFRNVSGDFSIYVCTNLTSLEGCPNYIDGCFSCIGCSQIYSLDFCPKEVNGDFHFHHNGLDDIDEQDVKDVCNIEGDIIV